MPKQKISKTAASPRNQREKSSKLKTSSNNPRIRAAKSKNQFHLPEITLPVSANNYLSIIIGIIIVSFAVLAFIALISVDRQNPDEILASLFFNLFGMGVYILPFTIAFCGIWLIFQQTRQIPLFSFERMSGVILFLLNILTFIHLINGGDWYENDIQTGGGYIGAFFAININKGFGKPAAFIILAAWLLISIGITLDLSIYDLFRHILRPLAPVKEQFRREWRRWITNFNARYFEHGDQNSSPFDVTSAEELPPEFRPLPRRFKTPGTNNKNEQKQETISSILIPEESPPPTTNWTLPTIEAILDPADEVKKSISEQKDRADLIEETLASFGAPGHVIEIHQGPTVTMFGVEPDFVETRSGKMRVRVSKIASLADDLALALAAPRIRIQAPVPGHNFVGIEVPNTEINRVTLRELLESREFKNIHSPLRFALGKDVSGNSIVADLKEMPHLLIAGTTGSGKSVCINTILSCFLLNNSPLDLRMILIDPKRVELSGYNGIPHLLTSVIVQADRVVGALQWVLREMDNRYHKFTKTGVRNINDFNISKPNGEYLPHLIVVVDELADLMMLAPDETERSITRLAQLARATGIHLIIATQRPSVDVVTGLIKANFPARIAFAVASGIDSRVIIDQPGAERLLGRGDMLFQPPDAPAPIRLQGAYVSDNEIQLLVDYWKFNAADPKRQSSIDQPAQTESLPDGVALHQIPIWDEKQINQGDPLLTKAIEMARNERRASITMLQRKLRVGYTRAARLIDSMEEQGIISKAQGSSQIREILDFGEGCQKDDANEG